METVEALREKAGQLVTVEFGDVVALHVEFQKRGVHVTVLLPGATDTPMIAASGFDPANMPIKPMNTTQCVTEGLAALSTNHTTHIPGRLNRIMAAVLPRSLATRMYGSMMRRTIAEQSVSTNNMLQETR